MKFNKEKFTGSCLSFGLGIIAREGHAEVSLARHDTLVAQK